MENLVLSDLEPVLRRYYHKDRLFVIGKPRSPLFMELVKNSEAKGQYRLAALHSDGGGRSGTFTDAQDGTSGTKQVSFSIGEDNLSDDFAIARVSNKAIKSADGKGSIIQALVSQADAKIRKMVRSAQIGLYDSDGARVMGVVATTPSTSTTLVLSNAYEARRFAVGDRVVAAATRTGALRDSGDFVTVTGVDPSTPSIEGDANWDTVISGIEATDFVFHKGDAANGGAVKGILGVPAWVPNSAPGATLFFGVNRSVDTEKLGGIRVDGSSKGTIREAIIEGASAVYDATQGDADITRCTVGVDEFKRLIVELDDTRDRSDKGRDATFGYQFVEAMFGPYTIRVYPDPVNHTGRAFLLDMDTWVLASLGGIPAVANLDGNKWLRVGDDSALEMRLEAYAQLGCQAPGYNANVNLPS